MKKRKERGSAFPAVRGNAKCLLSVSPYIAVSRLQNIWYASTETGAWRLPAFAGNSRHSAGNSLGCSGNYLDGSGNSLSSSGNYLDGSENTLDSSGNPLDSSGNSLSAPETPRNPVKRVSTKGFR